MRKDRKIFFWTSIFCFFLFLIFSSGVCYGFNAESSRVFISNQPEKLDRDGVLFEENIESSESIRLLYSHQNISSTARFVVVRLVNFGTTPAEVEVINGTSIPSIYAIRPGHQAALNYLSAMLGDKTEKLNISPGNFVNLVTLSLAPREVASGIITARLISRSQVKILVATSRSGSALNFSDKKIEGVFDPFCIHPHGIFSPANIVLEATHRAGLKATFVECGKGPWVIDKNTGLPNTGNYGIIYDINLDLINDSDEEYLFEFYFEPLNGKSVGSFIVDSQIKESEISLPYDRSLFYSLPLKAKESKKIRMVTLPEAGSCYPVKISVESKRLAENTISPEPEVQDATKNN